MAETVDGFNRIAIVNRGEAATRLIHAVRDRNRERATSLVTIALHTAAERGALFVRQAHEAVCLDDFATDRGRPDAPLRPYLDHALLGRAITAARADAVWPGWGFVAEDAAFAEHCAALGATFIGPSPAVMRLLGDKIAAKRLAEEAGVPVAPWSGGPIATVAEAREHARAIGYPLVVKAAAGGGGRGIRVVTSDDELDGAFESARDEAARAFGDATVFMEQRITHARHIEVQVIADAFGTVWPLGVRDCSIQRRHQKIIEESASPVLTDKQSAAVADAAARLCKLAGYENAGTVEFLYAPDTATFAFLEVNTRLQVEHPVTEMTTGLDLVQLQLDVAAGLPLLGAQPSPWGHAIEARLNAEDPQRDFAPAPGRIEVLALPTGAGIRIDTGVEEGDAIPAEYDSMIAKVVAWGPDRNLARARLARALDDLVLVVRGGATNKSFLLDLLARPEVADGSADTGWLDRLPAGTPRAWSRDAAAALVVAAIDAHDEEAALDRDRFFASAARGRPEAARALGQTVELSHAGHRYRILVRCVGAHGWYRIECDGAVIDAVLERTGPLRSRLFLDGPPHRVVSLIDGSDHVVEVDSSTHRFARGDAGLVRAPSAAVVVGVFAAPGDVVAAGAKLLVVESMKMETVIRAPVTGRVVEIPVAPNSQVEAGATLARLEAIAAPADATAAPAAAGEAVEAERLTLAAGAGPADSSFGPIDGVRACLAGFDVRVDEAIAFLERHHATRTLDPRAALRAELDALRIFADVTMLTRNRRDDGARDADEIHSPRERFRTYLRSVDVDLEGLPDRFRTALGRALAHYDVRQLVRTAALESALHHIFVAQQRGPTHAPVVVRILEHLELEALDRDLEPELRDTLDSLIVATQLRSPVIGNLARNVRYRVFDRPIIERVHAEAAIAAREALERLTASPDSTADLEALVATPQPLLPLVADRLADHATRTPVLEVLTRRYYKIRALEQVERIAVGNEVVVGAEYVHRGERVRLIATRGSAATVDAVLHAAATIANELDGDDAVVVDVYLAADAGVGALDGDALAELLLMHVQQAQLAPRVRRVAVSYCVLGDEVHIEQLTYRRVDDSVEFAEERPVRGLHPMISRRLRFWRLSRFAVTRLPSASDVYLYDCVAHDNPSDERLIALAEVRDATVVRDADGTVLGFPELEQVLASCLDSIRSARAAHPRAGQLTWNRVMLYIWPPVDAPADAFYALVERLAPMTEGLGFDQTVVQGRVADEHGALHEVVLRVRNQPGGGSSVRLEEPPTEPMRPLDEYTQKLVAARRRGAPYPYELAELLAGPGGSFVEHDLDADGRMMPVDRAPGRNRAAIVVARVRTPTERYPEGVARVAILGDPTKALGSLGEAECRLVLAAIDLAAEERLPIEWFALSAGARIAMNSGTENLDWVGRVLRRLVEHTQRGGEVNVVVTGINVGAQPYWNAEATMLMHTRGILVMTPDSAMVLTGKQALDYSGAVSAEDNLGLGGYERIMGPNGEAQMWAPDVNQAVALLHDYYAHTYVAPGEQMPRRATTTDPFDRDVRDSPHATPDASFTTIGEIFDETTNSERKRPFDMRTVMRAVADADHAPIERWRDMRDAETAIVFEAHLGGIPVCLLGVESRPLPRPGLVPGDGPDQWSGGTLFPLSSKKVARALNAASGNRPAVVLANLSGFDGSPESLRKLQLEYGAEIGRAVVNFAGPIVLCVVSRYHGGAFVVFSATLNDNMEVLAVEGSFASVIGGSAAAAVVFTGEVDGRVQSDPRVRALEQRVAAAPVVQRDSLRAELAELVAAVRLEKLGEVGAEFDAIHTVERALAVGSVHRVISAAQLRPALIAAIERGVERATRRAAD